MDRPLRSLVRLDFLCAGALAVACSGAATQAPAAGNVTYQGSAVSPTQVSVKPGEAVAWTNKDGTAHTVTSGTPTALAKAFDTKQVAGGTTARVTFDKAGTYDYFCELHESMRGQVQVR